MTDNPKLRAFITAVTFADGSVHLNAMAVPNEVCAMTKSGVEGGRRFQGPIAGFAYAELSAEFLRSMLRSIETGKSSGEVVSLVSDRPLGSKLAKVDATTDEDIARHMIEDDTPEWTDKQYAEAVAQHPKRFQWGEGHPVTQWPWLSRCEAHPHAPLLNGFCPICQPTGGAA